MRSLSASRPQCDNLAMTLTSSFKRLVLQGQLPQSLGEWSCVGSCAAGEGGRDVSPILAAAPLIPSISSFLRPCLRIPAPPAELKRTRRP